MTLDLPNGHREITDEFWTPDRGDQALLANGRGSAHETAGVLRMQRHGMTGSAIANRLKLRGTELMNLMQLALDQESIAHSEGLPIHDDSLKGYNYEEGREA